MRRRMGRRTGGLARTVGRTAVIAGTAQAVSGRVAMRQHAAHQPTARATARERKADRASQLGLLTDEIVDPLTTTCKDSVGRT